MARSIGWGILGCGSIARQLACAIPLVEGARLVAAGSRSADKSRAFLASVAASWVSGSKDEPRPCGSYEELVRDPNVDVVYVATPHPMHCEHAMLALSQGKAVLCEKPFTLNSAQARQVVALARTRGLFLMEAMWTRCFPAMRRVRDILREGGIGPVTMLSADFGFRADFDPRSRLFDPALGGGALLDVGVYCVSLASMVLGNPTGVRAHAVMAPTGVDARSGYLLSYASGALAVLYATVTAQTPWEASIVGDKGRIRIHPPFWKPSRITVSRSGEADQTVDAPYEGNGYQFEVEEVCRCLRGGLWESPEMPHDESIEIMETLDSIRAEIGLRYPGE